MNIKSILLTTVLAFATLGMTACDESRGNDFQGAPGQDGQDGQDGEDFDLEEFCADPANSANLVCDEDLSEFCNDPANADRAICASREELRGEDGADGVDGEDFDINEFCNDPENAENAVCLDRDEFCETNPENSFCLTIDEFCMLEDNAETKAICQDVEPPVEPETGGLIFNVQQTTAGLLNGTPLEVVNDGLNTLVDPQDGVLSPLTGALESASDDGGPLAPVRDGVNTLIVQPDSLRVVIDSLNQILRVLDPSALGGGGLPEFPGLPGTGDGASPIPGLDALPIDQACVIPFLGPLLVGGAGGSCN